MTQQPPTRRITVTYLQMLAPPPPPPRPPDGFQVLEAVDPPIHFYRYLYRAVGTAWDWRDREKQSDAQVLEIINPPQGQVLVPYWRGVPAGFAELNLSNPAEVQLQYFGLIPELIGSGLGRHFLAAAVQYVWTRQPRPRRFWLHTCTTDSPRALPCYLRAGFETYDQRSFDEVVVSGE